MDEKKDRDELERRVRLTELYDFYGPLLKDNQRSIFEDYMLNDLSLGEIAVEQDITRQGVHDVIKRCSTRLEQYEDCLQLVQKFQYTKERLMEIQMIAKNHPQDEAFKKISCISQEIYDVI